MEASKKPWSISYRRNILDVFEIDFGGKNIITWYPIGYKESEKWNEDDQQIFGFIKWMDSNTDSY